MRSVAATAAAVAGLFAFAAPQLASAHVGAGYPGRQPAEMKARAARRGLQRRQVTYNDQTWQSVTVPSHECSAYDYGPASTWGNAFPTAWDIADIVKGDTEAQNLYNSIAKGIPNIAPKGTPTSSEQGVTYNNNQDPDCWWTETTCTQPKLPGLKPDTIHCPEARTWGLTFDDGPNCTHNAFYDFLRSQKQTATMFYIGSNVLDWPLQAQRGLTDGHQLACHTWSHRYTTALTNTQVFAEFYYTIKVIKWTTGVTVTSWRPPYGDVDDRVRYIAASLGLDTVLWAADTNDWAVQPEGTAPTAEIQSNYASIISANAQATNGAIVLTHEIDASTMHMMMQEYHNIKSDFAHIVPVQTCLNNTTPYKEDIVYPDFAEYVAGNIMPSTVPAATDIVASSVASLAVGTNKPSYSVTDIHPSASSSVAASASASASASGSGSAAAADASGSAGAKSDKKSGGAPSPHAGPHAAVGALAGAALAAAGGAAALFV